MVILNEISVALLYISGDDDLHEQSMIGPGIVPYPVDLYQKLEYEFVRIGHK